MYKLPCLQADNYKQVFILQNKLYVHDLATGERKATLPLDVGSVAGYSGKKKQTEGQDIIRIEVTKRKHNQKNYNKK